MMKRTAIVVMLLLCAASMLPGCGAAGIGGKPEITKSAFLMDEETGRYSALFFVENNGLNPVKTGWCNAVAYDKDGKRISPVKDAAKKDEYFDHSLLVPIYWLCKGEKTAYMLTNAGEIIEDPEKASILDHYTAVPDTIEWIMDADMEEDPNLEPLGLSVAG